MNNTVWKTSTLFSILYCFFDISSHVCVLYINCHGKSTPAFYHAGKEQIQPHIHRLPGTIWQCVWLKESTITVVKIWRLIIRWQENNTRALVVVHAFDNNQLQRERIDNRPNMGQLFLNIMKAMYAQISLRVNINSAISTRFKWTIEIIRY